MILKKKSQSSPSASIEFSDNQSTLNVAGVLNFSNVVSLRNQGKKLLAQSAAPLVLINLDGIGKSDNSGLALLLAWIRDAHQLNKKIIFQNVPDFLNRMAQVFELHSILFKEMRNKHNG